MSRRFRLFVLIGFILVAVGVYTVLTPGPGPHPPAPQPEAPVAEAPAVVVQIAPPPRQRVELPLAPRPRLAQPELPPGAVRVLGDWRLRGVGWVFAISPDGERVVSNYGVWDLKTGRYMHEFRRCDDGRFSNVRFTRDSSTFVAVGYSFDEYQTVKSDIRRFVAATGEQLGAPVIPKLNDSGFAFARRFVLAHDGAAVFIYGSDVTRIDTVSGESAWTVPVEQPPGTPSYRPFQAKSVATSPDGRWVAVGVEDRVLNSAAWQETRTDWYIRVLDAAIGKEVSRVSKPGSIWSVFTPDGDKLVVATASGLAVFGVKNGAKLREFATPRASVPVAVSADGRWIAAQSSGIDVYGLATGKWAATIPLSHGHWGSSNESTVAFTPDGALAVSHRGGLGLHDPATGKLLPGSLDPPDLHEFTKLAFSPDGRALTAFNDFQHNYTMQWDVETGEEVRRAPPEYPGQWNRADEFLSEGRITTTQRFGVVRVIDPTGREVATVTIEPGWTAPDREQFMGWPQPGPNHKHLADVSRDGRFLFTTDNETVERFDVATGKKLDVLADFTKLERHGEWEWHPHSLPPSARPAVRLSPCGRFVLIFPQIYDQGHIPMQVFEVVSGKKLAEWIVVGRSGSGFLGWAVDGGRLATASYRPRATDNADGRLWVTEVEVREIPSGRVVVRSEFAEMAWHTTISPDLRSCTTQPVTGSSVTESVNVVEVATGRVRHQFTPGAYRGAAAFSPDGRLLATVGGAGPVVLWDVRGERSRPATPPDDAALARAWEALVGSDAPAAFAAIRLLAAFPDKSLPLLEAMTAEWRPIDLLRLWVQIRALDVLGVAATIGESRRAIRAVEAVEWIRTKEAIRLLERWSGGARGDTLTVEASAALARLRGIVPAANPVGAAPPAEEPATKLGVKGTEFTLNGRPTFLYGISYYGGLGAPEEAITKDLADAKKHGFNWIRVWATWGAFENDVSAVDAEGKPREKYLKKLQGLVAECDKLGIVVDVTLSRGNGATGPARLQTLEAHRRAVETVITALKGRRNWYLDIGNERSVKDKRFVSFADLKELRELARKLDPDLLVTASHGSDITKDEFREYLNTAKVDFVSPHRPRETGSPKQTEQKTKEYLAWGKELERPMPVHYQEPFRRGYAKWEPKADDFVADLKGAKAGGAAGWCFHNGDNRTAKDGQPRRSFDLREKHLFEQLDEEELKALPLLK